MKKLLVLAAIAVFGFGTMNAQSFAIQVNGALPSGDVADGYSFGAQLSAAYLFEVTEGVKIGPSAGVLHFFGSDIELLGVTFPIDDATFVPIGATGRVMLGDAFAIGADLGYGLGVAPDGNDGGFYYKPMVMYAVSEAINIVAGYAGVSVEGGTFSSINAGIEFAL